MDNMNELSDVEKLLNIKTSMASTLHGEIRDLRLKIENIKNKDIIGKIYFCESNHVYIDRLESDLDFDVYYRVDEYTEHGYVIGSLTIMGREHNSFVYVENIASIKLRDYIVTVDFDDFKLLDNSNDYYEARREYVGKIFSSYPGITDKNN